ncbi:MAG: hypothetical protein ACC628_03225 [Pirellulaceae bacterium]
MKRFRLAVAAGLVSIACCSSPAQEPPQVLVTDSGVQTGTIGPGAPAHTIGLQRHQQTMVMDTGTQTFGLQYVIARDPKDPLAAIPGEGYIGMPQPEGCNWYAGGFIDLRINGQTIGTTLIHSLTGRRSEGCGTVDFVFDTPEAVIRVRFVARAGEDCLYAQALLEPKVEIKSVRVVTRCYPSAFVTRGDRHVLTPTRDVKQGEKAELNNANEWWTLYYDRIYDAGYVGTTRRGIGPCAMLWVPSQIKKASFTVGSYGIETVFDLKPTLRDFRFLFWDYAGKKNEVAKVDLSERAQLALQELMGFAFIAPSFTNWPLQEKQVEVQQVLASVPDDKETAVQYERWGRELAAQSKQVQSGSRRAIMAEASAAKIIDQWERGLPALKLKALLNEI